MEDLNYKIIDVKIFTNFTEIEEAARPVETISEEDRNRA